MSKAPDTRPAPQTLSEAGYEIEIAVQGYPGKSVCHGTLGWSTIALLRGHGRVALIDTGSFGQRHLILDRLSAKGLTPDDVTDVLLTHSHWDHSINCVMFPKARIHIGGTELSWSLTVPWGTTQVPELYVRELENSSQTIRIEPGSETIPNMSVHSAPGHTPGHLFYLVSGSRHDVIFTGDAAKNRAELVSRTADMSYDQSVSRNSLDTIWAAWRRRPGTVLIPGHDVPMIIENGEPRYLGRREADIAAWFGTTLDQLTIIDLAAS
ncbi:MAG TPA: MBL fold metallo-hydrolase [Rhizomicrobium sp.]|jgi:glyoxylase-like metal-dependent hydrolase (beta-lactamase superfamily II)|nr:MBL fold metallo-hydrolase [Rhizomicrobium sp.]